MRMVRMTLKEFKEYQANHKPSKGYAVIAKKKKARKASSDYQDGLWSIEVRQRAGFLCEWCLQVNKEKKKAQCAHHVISCSVKQVRIYPPNGVALCNGHHKFVAHKYPHKFLEWIKALRGESWWQDLNTKSNTQKAVFTKEHEPIIYIDNDNNIS